MIEKPLSEVAELLKVKEISPTELFQSIKKQIDAREPETNAFITLTLDLAEKQAINAEKEILKGNYKGAIHGVPISIKDLIYTRGIKTTNGSKIDKDFIPNFSAKLLENLVENGAVVVGKTNLHEYANGITTENKYYGFTKNPLNLNHTPGGSSGGSAASVAANMAYASVGTDTGGSIRIPASCCGLVGLKPTYGLINSHGVTPLSWSLDHVGPIAKTAKDTELMLLAMLGSTTAQQIGKSLIDENFNFKNKVVGIPSNYFFEHIDPEVERNIKKAIKNIEMMGAVVKEISLPNLDKFLDAHLIICGVEAATFHKERLKHHLYDFERDSASFLKLGQKISGTQYVLAQQIRSVIYSEMLDVFNSVETILAPTLPVLPPPVGTKTINMRDFKESILSSLIRYTSPFNMTGFPVVSIPVAKNEHNLSTGMQIVGEPGAESKILSMAHHYLNEYPV